MNINPLNAELNPICHLLALLVAHLILHISRIRVNIVYIKFLLQSLKSLILCNVALDLYAYDWNKHFLVIQSVSGGIVNILGSGSMDYSE
jgi:hypothetical protein